VVKALNTMVFTHLPVLRRPHGAVDRSALPIVGEDDAGKTILSAFLDAIGFDSYDVWRPSLSADEPRSAPLFRPSARRSGDL
jgi:hypothetical protein